MTSSSQHGGRKYLPYVFTGQGVSMLSAVLKSKIAIEVSIKIINSFVNMRKFIFQNADIFNFCFMWKKGNHLSLYILPMKIKFEVINMEYTANLKMVVCLT